MLGILCTLITALTYVDAVIVLTQTPAVHTVSTGQEVVLNCNIERYDGNSVRWYKQVPGEAPQYVLRFSHGSSSPSFGSGFSSDRFNSKSSSNIDYQFIIKRSEAGDSAVYYCQTWDDSASAAVSQWFTPWQKPHWETHNRFYELWPNSRNLNQETWNNTRNNTQPIHLKTHRHLKNSNLHNIFIKFGALAECCQY